MESTTYVTKALPTGKCDKACGAPKGRKTVVCPLGFWGLNRVIERHAFDAKSAGDADFAIESGRAAAGGSVRVLESALFAASAEVDRARSGTIRRVEKVLKDSAGSAAYVTGWRDWVAKVRAESRVAWAR